MDTHILSHEPQLMLLTPLTMGSNHNSSPMRDRAWIAFPKAATQQPKSLHVILSFDNKSDL